MYSINLNIKNMAEIIIFLSVYAFVVLVDRESSDDKKDVKKEKEKKKEKISDEHLNKLKEKYNRKRRH